MPKFHVGNPTPGTSVNYGLSAEEIAMKKHLGENANTLSQDAEYEAFKLWRDSGGMKSIEDSTSEVIQRRNQAFAKQQQTVKLVKEEGFEGLEDACPYCISKKETSLLDIMPHSGKHQCRRCGKCWYEECLYYPEYSKALERYTRDDNNEKEQKLRLILEKFQQDRLSKANG